MGWTGKVEILEVYPDVSVASARARHELPAVLRVVCYVHRVTSALSVPLNRRNIMLRDNYMCQCVADAHAAAAAIAAQRAASDTDNAASAASLLLSCVAACLRFQH
jgi:hypothetical protein